MQVQGAFAPGGAQSQAVVESDEPAVPAHAVTEAPAVESVHALAKPPVRKLAKDLGVDLATVTATGPNGTITPRRRAGGRGREPVLEGEPLPAEAGHRQMSWGSASAASRSRACAR